MAQVPTGEVPPCIAASWATQQIWTFDRFTQILSFQSCRVEHNRDISDIVPFMLVFSKVFYCSFFFNLVSFCFILFYLVSLLCDI